MNVSTWNPVQSQSGVGTFPLMIQRKILPFKTYKFITEAAIFLPAVLSLTLTQSTPPLI